MSCNQQNPACNNPCKPEHKNTAAHETLESQVLNFSKEFFGELVQTQVDGQTFWSLPCRLDVGLPNNLRGATEPLGCYFMRLFQNGITGLTGVEGNPGRNGRNGRVAYVSGGAIIVGPQGPRGPQGNHGPQGQQGITGNPGAKGTWYTPTYATGQTAFQDNGNIQGLAFHPPVGSYGLVTNTTPAQLTVPATGTYLWFYTISGTVLGNTDGANLFTKLRNSTTSNDIPHSTFNHMEPGNTGISQIGQPFATVTLSGVTSAATNDVIGVYAQTDPLFDDLLRITWAAITIIRIA